MTADVVIAGGGSAGLAAAVSSARAGAQTLLFERHGALGGMVPSALVHSICGLYRLRDEPGSVPAHRGFPAEFASRLLACGGASGPVRMGRVDVLLQQPIAFAWVADQLAQAERNLTVRFHTELISADANGDGIESVGLICRGRRETVWAKAFVDATGDALLTEMAGGGCEQAATLQRPAFIFSLCGVATAAMDGDGRLGLARRLATAVGEGALPKGVLGAHFRPSGESRQGEVFVTVDLDNPPGHPEFDPASPESLAAMEFYGRELAHALALFLRRSAGGFESAYLAAFPTRAGVRESRRIQGEIRIEAADILEGATFPDAVSLSAWPIEMREQATGPRLRFPNANRPCEVPLRALRVRGVRNLFAAGRCISSSHEAQAALRVIATCMGTGEAAGFAAALLAGGDDPSASAIEAAREKRADEYR